MRYFFLLLLVPSLLGLLSRQAVAETEVEQERPAGVVPAPDFWPQAQQLIQEQIFLITRIERAIAGPDPNQVRAAQGQITLHAGAVDRFLRRNYSLPNLLCGPAAATNQAIQDLAALRSDLNAPQQQVFCALYASTQRLTPLVEVLDQRLQMLSTLAEVKPLPLITGEWRANGGVPQFERPNLGAPARSVRGSVPNVPPPPPSLGRPVKPAIANYTPPAQPAIVPPANAIATLQAARALLAQAQVAFPTFTAFIDPAQEAQRTDQVVYGLYAPEVQLYEQFLAQPNTGMARVQPTSAYATQPNVLRNRLAPTVLERFPFTPVLERSDGFVHQFTLQVANGRFQIPQSNLDYGFMVDLGDVPLDDLSNLPPEQIQLPVQTRRFFYTYRPPTELAALQVDQRRFTTGKVGNFVLKEPLSAAVPAVVNHTYLMRSLQFQLPEALLTGEPVTGRQRRYLDQLLEAQGSDVLIAFRPVSRRLDGSYTVLWRVLAQFPEPKIQDLDEYVQYTRRN